MHRFPTYEQLMAQSLKQIDAIGHETIDKIMKLYEESNGKLTKEIDELHEYMRLLRTVQSNKMYGTY